LRICVSVFRISQLANHYISLTELEVGVVGANVVAGTQQSLHHQSCAHGVKQPKVLRDATLLETGREGETEA
jgi:hypothetical protein